MFFYLELIVRRFPIDNLNSTNEDLKEIFWRHQFSYQPEDIISGEPGIPVNVFIEQVSAEPAFLQYIDSVEKDLIVKGTIELFEDEEFSTEKTTKEIYYLKDWENYVVMQGVLYCSNILSEEFEDLESVYKQFNEDIFPEYSENSDLL